MKLSRGKKKKLSKTNIINCGLDRDGEPILVYGITRGMLNNIILEAEEELYKEHNIPTKLKSVKQLNEVERELYNINERNEDVATILVYDETNPKVKSIRKSFFTIFTNIHKVASFDMNRKIEDEDGGESFDGWEYFNDVFDADIEKGSYYQLAKFLSSEKGFTEYNWLAVDDDIKLLKEGVGTVGDEIYKNILNGTYDSEEYKDFQEEHKEELEKVKKELEESNEDD